MDIGAVPAAISSPVRGFGLGSKTRYMYVQTRKIINHRIRFPIYCPQFYGTGGDSSSCSLVKSSYLHSALQGPTRVARHELEAPSYYLRM